MNLTKLKSLFVNYNSEWISSKPLAALRILISFLMFVEVFQILYFSELIYGISGAAEVKLTLYFWLFTLVALGLGIYTRLAAIVNYILTILIIGAYDEFEYHIDYVYITISLLFIFYPISKSWSLDNKIKKRPPEFVPRIYNDSLIFIFIAALYADSCFFKFTNRLWSEGLGWWLPASTTYATFLNINFLLNQKLIVHLMGYTTLIFEAVFIFLMWIKPFRPILFVLGVVLHLGILISFPIPIFATAMVGLYILFLPDEWLSKTFHLKTNFENRHYDIKNSPALYSMVFVAIMQVFIILGSESWSSPIWHNLYQPVHHHITRFTGLTRHPVFVDRHFGPIKEETAIVYVAPNNTETWLPIINSKGQVSSYLTGRFWVQWNFRAMHPWSENNKTYNLLKWIRFWAYKNKITPGNGHFIVKTRPIHFDYKWEMDRLKKQTELPWQDSRTISWNDLRL
jgi:hypothetical protein